MSDQLDAGLLALLREQRPAPREARERIRTRLAAVVPGMGPAHGGSGSGSGGGGGSAQSPSGAAGTALTGALRGPAALVAAFVTGTIGGFALHAAVSSPPPPRVVYVDREVPAPPPAVPSSTFAPEATVAPPASTSVSAVASRSAPVASGTSQLAAERALLDEARAGLVGGDPALALERLEQHQHRFLNPMLGEERDAMWIEALVQDGRPAEARVRADAFRRKYPASLFLPTVDSVVGPNP